MQASLAALGPVPEPEDLLLRIRVAVSQERARQPPERLPRLESGLEEHRRPFLLQASAGFASAVLLMGTVIVLVTMFAQPEIRAGQHPTSLWARPPRRTCSISPDGAGSNQIGAVSGPVVVEAYVNGEGQVYDYRIVSGPTDAATRAQVENLLLWSVFEPARRFGQPVRGLAVLSFSGVSVRG